MSTLIIFIARVRMRGARDRHVTFNRHDVAEAAGLFSHSEGDGDDKDVFITKVCL